MPAISNRFTTKQAKKHATTKALRRENHAEIATQLAPEPEPDYSDDYEYCWAFEAFVETTVVAGAVLVYDDGLDYDVDGNAYFDDYPSWFPHSYHHSVKEAEAEAAWLEHRAGVKPDRIRVVENYRVDEWDMNMIPPR